MEMNPDHKPTILDYLNEDTWRLVLDYLPLDEILRSERVSRRWQHIVTCYLAGRLYREGIRRFRIQYRRFRHGTSRGHDCRILTLDNADPAIFDRITRKLGPLVVASDCINQASFWSIVDNCPNIESVTISGAIETQLLHSQVENFKRLKNLTFKRCRFSGVLEGEEFHADLPDYCIKKFLESETLEELKIYNNTQVDGSCLSALQHKLKSLSFINCPNLSFKALLDNIDQLSELTKLELNGNSQDILRNVYLLLDKMPNLEYLSLSHYKKTELPGVTEALGRLERLRHLCVKDNENVTDEWLQAMGRCKKLNTVDIGRCREKIGFRRVTSQITSEGVLALCRSLSSTLTALSVTHNYNLSYEDVVDCVSACPRLTTLDLQGCSQLSYQPCYLINKVERATRGRPQSLRLRLYVTALPGATVEEKNMERHGSLILDFHPRQWRLPEDCPNCRP